MEDKFEVLIQGLLEAGYGMTEDFIPADLVKALNSNLQKRHGDGRMHSAGVGKQDKHTKNTLIRGDTISWIDKDQMDSPESEFQAIITNFIDYLNRTCFTGLNDSEFHYARYEAGSFYKRHRDQFQSDSGRKFSLVTYLNESWSEGDGGNLRIFSESSPETKIYPKGGRTVFFRSDILEHEVEVAKLARFSITGWLKSS